MMQIERQTSTLDDVIYAHSSSASSEARAATQKTRVFINVFIYFFFDETFHHWRHFIASEENNQKQHNFSEPEASDMLY